LKITAEFITSAAEAAGLPRAGLTEIAMVGRSNVGKSSLINALLRQRIARTSAAPGKTRLANVYRVAHGTSRAFLLVDLPGYGYTRGGTAAVNEFEALSRAYFERPGDRAVVLLVDMRHPGLLNDRAALAWLRAQDLQTVVVGTKIDKLARGQRIRAQRELESVLEDSVLPVSAVTGEGLDELWTLIDRLAANSQITHPRSRTPHRPPRPTVPRNPTRRRGQPAGPKRPRR
jgi:GTP-binding protein